MGFLVNESKIKECSNSNEQQIKFPWTFCGFDMGLLLASSFKNEWKPVDEIEQD